MNAHDRLRLYLEQRRELGESELVLDGLPVDAVLKMIGAPSGKRADSAAGAAPSNTTSPDAKPNDSPRATNANRSDAAPGVPETTAADAIDAIPPVDPAPRFDSGTKVDWRAALSGLAPGAEQKSAREKNSDRAVPERPTDAASSGNAKPANDAPPPIAPIAPVAPSPIEFPAWLTNLGIPAGLSANALGESATSAAANACNSLDELAAVITGCRACALGASAINAVPGEGNADADFVCVGEAPGQTEDETGRPFVGAAGDLLTKILAAIQLQRQDVFICNVLKHRPPGNRDPKPDEVHACTPYLTRQLALVKPKVILALGTFAAQTLLNTTTSLGKLRGQVHRYQGVPLIVTYHPAALLRNESWKRPAWDDVKLARKILDAARVNASNADGSRDASSAS